MRVQLPKREFCTTVSKNLQNKQQWSIKQVKKSNFEESLEDIKSHISGSDFIAVSLRKTGSHSATWHRVSPFDTPETAYFKAKFAADRFQILQFAVCPFTVTDSKLIAHPYNFHLFPRDELKIGMPSYSFSCQASYLTSMVREGFDFNACIYDGISYLSRVQESSTKIRIENLAPSIPVLKSSTPTVADVVFIERIKSRVKHWKNECKDSSTRTDDALVRSLRKLVLQSEEYNSRPCMTIDVCSERQVQLILEMLGEFSDDVVPLIIPAKGGETQAVRVVLASSKEDKNILERELHNLEDEQNKRVRGFREVIDLISASQKLVVSHNSFNDFTFIHSKFIAPLPPDMDEFMCSLRMVFPRILDVNHLIKEIGPLKKVTNISGAISYLKSHFFAPIDIEIPQQAVENESKIHEQNVVRMCHLFAKVCSVLKISPIAIQSGNVHMASALEGYANILNPSFTAPLEPIDGDVRVWTNNSRKVSCKDLVFLWGFRGRMTAGMLKRLLQGSHQVFTEEFDVRIVDKSCAIVVFWQPGCSDTFLGMMNSKEICGTLREMVSEGLRATGYETYKRACSLGLWEAGLADSLDKALVDPDSALGASSETNPSEIYCCNESMINLDDL
ncbi:CAF1 domain-containing protein, partial [Cephalotus follicularis]